MTDWELLIPSVWVSLIIITGLVLFLWLCYAYLKTKKIFLYLRIAIFIILLILVLQPVKNIREKLSSKPVVAVLIDNSDSMNISDPVPRKKQSRDLLRANPFRKLMEKYDLQYYSFSDNIIPGIDTQTVSGKNTDIAQAFEYLHDKIAQNLVGVILLSDGIHNTSSDPLLAGNNLNATVYTIGVGNPQPKDLAVTTIKHSDFVFKNIATEIEVVIRNSGYNELEIPVTLKENKDIIQTQRLKILANNESMVKFKFTPDEVGEHIYQISIPVYQDEVVVTNNTRSFLLPVVREKVRVLYLCGQPNYEYAFLRNVLKNDPSTEIVSFTILRNPENIIFVPDEQLSLIPFPIHEIFQKQLIQFDLLIMENFTYTRFGIPLAYLESIHHFVTDKGGGLIFIGGENAFGHGGYKNTPVEDLLPVEISTEERIDSSLFRMDVLNFSHPVTNLGLDIISARQIWNQMPELDGCNRLGKVKPGAVVLGMHPTQQNADGRLPILVVCQKGKGRVMLMAANTTWRWAMGAAAQGRSPDTYTRFWQQAIRWVTKSQEVKLVRLVPEKVSLKQNEKVKFKINVYDEYYRPLAKAKLRLIQTSPRGDKTDLAGGIYTIAAGEYWIDIELSEIGRYNFEVKAFSGDKYIDEDSVSCEVSGFGEKDVVALNETLLKDIATLSNGKYFHISKFKPEELVFPENIQKLPIKKKIVFWDKVYFYGLLILLLGIEWYFRRRRGMM